MLLTAKDRGKTMPEFFKPSRILVPVDFSPSSRMALSAAGELARQCHSSVFFVNIIPMLPIVPRPGSSTMFFPQEEYLADARKYAEEHLALSVKELHASGVNCSSGVEIGNDVVGNIMMVLDREQSDLIVISTHGVSGWRPVVFGSIAEQVIKLVKCPLLLLRTPAPSV